MGLKKNGLLVLMFAMMATVKCASDTTIVVNEHKVVMQFTSKPVKGTVLLLQGWNFPPDDWCVHTDICRKLLDKGYHLVMPDMGKSIYHSAIYKETRTDWVKYPTRRWLVDTLFVLLQKDFQLLDSTRQNFVIGLSTGARGAVLVAMDCPGMFAGVAALSGDYDQTKMTGDNLCKGYYGAFVKFKSRWRQVDNPTTRIKELTIPIYLGHGMSDKVVPVSQTIQFYKELRKQCPLLKAKLSTPTNNHDYQYWASEVDSILRFFDVQ
jgi:S-formylglutathione hydrolase FrmB